MKFFMTLLNSEIFTGFFCFDFGSSAYILAFFWGQRKVVELGKGRIVFPLPSPKKRDLSMWLRIWQPYSTTRTSRVQQYCLLEMVVVTFWANYFGWLTSLCFDFFCNPGSSQLILRTVQCYFMKLPLLISWLCQYLFFLGMLIDRVNKLAIMSNLRLAR